MQRTTVQEQQIGFEGKVRAVLPKGTRREGLEAEMQESPLSRFVQVTQQAKKSMQLYR
jgi:hypothetical protein